MPSYAIVKICLTKKINIENLAHFSPQKNVGQRTTFYHASTTTSPQKHHTQTPDFPEPPPKTPAKTRNPGSLRGSFLRIS
jgi:hypothetical protein